MAKRFKAEVLVEFAKRVLQEAGMRESQAQSVASILVEGDLLGHNTHGLGLLSPYVKDLVEKRMVTAGEPEVISDSLTATVLDGRYMPGPWLVLNAIEECFKRVEDHAMATVVIRKSHHIACLGAYLKRITDKGYIGFVLSSDPNHASVAPFGGFEPKYSPNPIAVGIPTEGNPILIDMSTSSTANGVVKKHLDEGRELKYPWLLDNKGEPTQDPKKFFTTPPGSILPLGGMDLGYKGFALGILVEALTSALGGYGRADSPTQWGGAVFVQVINPQRFAGQQAFLRETSFFANSCLSAAPLPGTSGVMMPGTIELDNWKRQSSEGVALTDAIVASLTTLATQFDVDGPSPL